MLGKEDYYFPARKIAYSTVEAAYSGDRIPAGRKLVEAFEGMEGCQGRVALRQMRNVGGMS